MTDDDHLTEKVFDTIARTIGPEGTERLVRFPYIGRDGIPITEVKLSDMVDALLYFGPSDTLTFTPPVPRADISKTEP